MPNAATAPPDHIAFPRLDDIELEALKPLATLCTFEDGDTVFSCGDADLDLFVVDSGGIDILNPVDGDKHIVTHGPNQFAGDIDLLTRRPIIVKGVAHGATRLWRVPSDRIRELLNKAPMLGEKLLTAIQERRRLLMQAGVLGLRVVGPGKCRETMQVREFLHKNFVPFTWFDSALPDGEALLVKWGSPTKFPVVQCDAGLLLANPSLRELAEEAGVWHHCPKDECDLAIVGAGPAGMAAAVYAASEGVSTVVLDRLGPGGQASASSKIENFIGFPSGLSGAEFATRSVLQMLKFGATMVAPVNVDRIEPAAVPGERHTLYLDCGNVLRARTVLVAGGVSWRRLEVPGAERFESQGIHYACTSVEAVLYDQHDVIVVGGGNSAGQAAVYLAQCCPDRTVHVLVRRPLGTTMSEYLVGRIRAASNIRVHEGVEIADVQGERRVESVTLRAARKAGDAGADSAQQSAEPLETIQVGAVFVFIGAEPGCSWLPEGIARDKLGYILTGMDALRTGLWPLTDREPCPLETTIPGILAAGDIRAGSTKRVGFAVGDGSLAVTCVHKLTAIRN
jgi:thioredoxin reductase (NADPH)